MTRTLAVLALLTLMALPVSAQTPNGDLPGPFPLFPSDNWWNTDVSAAPVDGSSNAFITFVGPAKGMHPDFGGEDGTPEGIYGFPYVVVPDTQPKVQVQFLYDDESDGNGLAFYPIPPEAATSAHWIEGGQPGNVDLRDDSDRHLLLIDATNKHLYELYNVWYDGAQWHAGSGAFFDMNTNDRRPEGWTSADAAGLAILPGLARYEEVFLTPDDYDIGHAFRMTVRATNGHVYPASHTAGSTSGALPMGARLRLKAGKDISGFTPEVQKIFRAMKKYGLIVADNGSDMYVSGTFDTRWDNDVLNPAFASLHASDFEVVKRGWKPGDPVDPPSQTLQFSAAQYSVSEAAASVSIPVQRTGGSSGTVTVEWEAQAAPRAPGTSAPPSPAR